MATPQEIAAVSTAVAKLLQSDINTMIPPWAKGMIPADMATKLAYQVAEVAVNTVDAYRTKEKST